MKEFKYKIKDFDLVHTFECGQCFRWERIESQYDSRDNSVRYIGTAGGRVAIVSLNAGELIVKQIGKKQKERASFDMPGIGAVEDITSRFEMERYGTDKNDSDYQKCFGDGSTVGIEKSEADKYIANQAGIVSEQNDDQNFWYRYFDLGRDYGAIKRKLKRGDDVMKRVIAHGEGIRILRQDPWEATLSFLISQNNNIPRIKKNIWELSAMFGTKIPIAEHRDPKAEMQDGGADGDAQIQPADQWTVDPTDSCSRYDDSAMINNCSIDTTYTGEWHNIPTPKVLAGLTEDDLAPIKLGYRAKFIIESARMIADRGIDILYGDPCQLPGVGPKVANCIRLYGLGQSDSFPIDVWVKRFMIELYGIENVSEMAEFAAGHFGEYGGMAQQYLFYYMRENH